MGWVPPAKRARLGVGRTAQRPPSPTSRSGTRPESLPQPQGKQRRPRTLHSNSFVKTASLTKRRVPGRSFGAPAARSVWGHPIRKPPSEVAFATSKKCFKKRHVQPFKKYKPGEFQVTVLNSTNSASQDLFTFPSQLLCCSATVSSQ